MKCHRRHNHSFNFHSCNKVLRYLFPAKSALAPNFVTLSFFSLFVPHNILSQVSHLIIFYFAGLFAVFVLFPQSKIPQSCTLLTPWAMESSTHYPSLGWQNFTVPIVTKNVILTHYVRRVSLPAFFEYGEFYSANSGNRFSLPWLSVHSSCSVHTPKISKTQRTAVSSIIGYLSLQHTQETGSFLSINEHN